MSSAGDGPLFNLTGATSSRPQKSNKRPRSEAAIFDEHAKRFSATADSIRAVARKSPGGADEPEALRTQGELLVLELKRAARGLRECLCEGVGTVEQASTQADGVAVQLHGLAYEKGHLEREIAFERRFGSAHEQIVLPSAKDMPPAKSSASSSASSSSSEHQLMLELLAYELTLREQFVGEESALAERRTTLQGQVATKRTFLEDDLPAQLVGLCAAAKPLASFKPSKGEAASSVALGAGSALPAPLFTLVSQFEAHRDEFADGAMAVRVVGDDAAAAVAEEPQAKQRRTDGASRTAALAPFPLSVEVTHEASGKRGGTLRLTFTYLPELETITADGEWKPSKGRKKLAGPELLADLFEGDQGLELPNPASVHVLGSGTWSGDGAGKPAGKARPYRWAQWLGGLYYPRPNSAAEEATAKGLAGDAGQSWSVYETLQRILSSVE